MTDKDELQRRAVRVRYQGIYETFYNSVSLVQMLNFFIGKMKKINDVIDETCK